MKKAIIFPGQGSQKVGMGKALVEAHPDTEVWFDRASEALGWDLKRCCFEGPVEELNQTDKTQPAIFVVSAMAFEVLKKENRAHADVFAGHSLGEWTAIYASGMVDFENTVQILNKRGQLMQQAALASAGSMLAVLGLDADAVKQVASQAGVSVANFNDPTQTVLSGKKEGIAQAEILAKEAGARRAVQLPVSGAFHSPLMQPAADEFAAFLENITFNKPQTPVLSNVTGVPHEDVDGLRQNMIRQITGSVRWVENVQWMHEQGVEELIECGSGKVLAGLIKRINKELTVSHVEAAT